MRKKSYNIVWWMLPVAVIVVLSTLSHGRIRAAAETAAVSAAELLAPSPAPDPTDPTDPTDPSDLTDLTESPARASDPEPAPAPAPTPAPVIEPAGPTATTPESNIRFQFDGMPYMDVVQRFAQMANKPLLTDTTIEGTLTFDDSRPYTYSEAFDTLNTILSMKNVMVTEEDRYIRLVPFQKLPQMPLKIFRGLDATGDVSPGEVVTVVLELKNLDAGEVSKSVATMLSPAGSIAPLSRGTGLILTDRLSSIQRVRQLLAEVDTASPVERTMRTYTLLTASGAVVSDLINKTFGAATAPKRTIWNDPKKSFDTLPPDPNDYVTAVFDEASRTLVMFGPAERVLLAEELIKRFEDKEDGRGGEVKIFYPKATAAAELARMIRQAIPGVAAENESPTAVATKARVIVDAPMNRLIVAAPIAGQIDAIENLFNKVERGSGVLDEDPKSERVHVTRVVRLQVASPSAVMNVLTNSFQRRAPNGEWVMNLKATLDEASRSVVVTGTPGEVQQAGEIISSLDEGWADVGPLQTKVLEFSTAAEVRRVGPLVQQLYKDQVSNPQRPGEAHARFLPDPDSRRILVTASTEHLQIIDGIAKELRPRTGAHLPRIFRALPLKHVRVDAILATLNQLVQERTKDELFMDAARPLILADAVNNRVLVTANAPQVEEIQLLLQTLDIAPQRGAREIVRVPLNGTTAAQLLPTLNQLVRPLMEAHTEVANRPEIIADASGKQLFLTGTAEDLKQIKAWIEELQGSGAESAARVFRTVELNRKSAAEAVPLLEQLYRDQLKGLPDPAGGAATFIPEARGNRIMLVGPAAELARAEAILMQLDPPDATAAVEETRVLRLKSAVAADLAGLIEKTMDLPGQKVRVQVDTRSNSLVISGERESVESATKLVGELDSAPNLGPREMRIINLKSGEAERLAPMVMDLFKELLADQRGPNYTSLTRIVPDPSGNRLIVSGVLEEVVLVSQVVDRLDQQPEQGETSRVFNLVKGDAVQVARILNETLVSFDRFGRSVRKATAAADEKSNSIVVTGEREDLQAAELIVERLEGDTSSTPRAVRVIELESADPAALVKLATDVWSAQFGGRTKGREVTLTLDPTGRRVIAVAPVESMAQVEQVLQALDQRDDGPPRVTEVIPLVDQRAGEVLPLLKDLYMQGRKDTKVRPANLMAHPDDGRLIVFGSAEQVGEIRELLEQIRGDAGGRERLTTSFEMRTRENADRLLPLVRQLYQDRIGSRPSQAPADAQFLMDPKTARLIVTARQTHLDLIGDIIGELDQGGVEVERETSFFDVGHSEDVRVLLPLIQQLYREQFRDKGPEDPADATILADERGGRIIATGRKSSLEAIGRIVERLKETRSPSPQRQTRVYHLNTSLAAELAQTLRTIYAEELKNHPGISQPDALILPDTVGNRLLITARTAELDIIEPLLKKIDDVSPQTANTRVFKLKSANVTQLAAILSSSLVNLDRGFNRMTPRVSVGADIASNSLVVSGEVRDLNAAATIIEQLDAGASREAREIRILPLKAGRALDIANLTRGLYTEQVKSRHPGEPADAVILPDPISDRLLLTATPSHLIVIEEIVEKLDAMSSDASRQLQILSLVNQDATRVSTMVQQFFTADVGHADPRLRLMITALADQKTLVLEAPKPVLARVQSFIRQIETTVASAEDDRETRAFLVGASDVQRVLGLLRPLYESTLKGRHPNDAPDAQFLPDPTTGRLLVTGRAHHLEVIETALATVKPETAAADRITRHLSIGTPEEVQRLLPLVQQLYREELRGLESQESADAQFIADATAGRIIVTARPTQLDRIERIVKDLQSGTQVSRDRDTRIYSLTAASATELALTVGELFEQELKKRPGAVQDRALILPDPMSNRLIVSGPVDQIQDIEAIIQKLDQVTTQTGGARVFKLKYAEPDQVASILSTALVRWERGAGRTLPRVSVGVDSKNRTLVISGEARDLNAAAAIIEQLDGQLEREERKLRIIPVSTGMASDIATKARQIHEDQVRAQPGGVAADALILPDLANDRLILTATAAQLESLEEIIRSLDPKNENPRQWRVVTLRRNSAAAISSVATKLFTRQMTHPDTNQRLMVTATPDDRTLVIEGTLDSLAKIEELVTQLDQVRQEEGYQVRAYHLSDSRATELAPTLARLFAERNPSTAAIQPRFEADSSTNMLLVGAAPGQFESVEALIEELKATASVSNEIRTFRLVNSDSTQVAEILRTMLGAEAELPPWMQQRFQRGAVRDPSKVNVAAATAVNAVVVQGPPGILRTAEQIVRNLDGEETSGQTVIQSVRLKKAAPEAVAEAVNRAMAGRTPTQSQNFYWTGTPAAVASLQKARVTPVANSNTVLVDGPADAVAAVMEIIRELDSESQDGDVEIRIYKIENGRVRELSTLLNQMLRGVLRDTPRAGARRGAPSDNVTISTDERTNSLIVAARPEQFRVIEKVLVTLDQSGQQTDRNVQFVWLKNLKAVDAQARLELVYEGRSKDERPIIDADIYSNSLTVIARSEDLREIETLVQQMEAGSRDTSTRVRLLVIDTLPAEEMAQILLSLFPQVSGTRIELLDKLPTPAPRDRTRPQGVSTNALVLPPAEEGDQEPPVVYVAVDKSANALLLSGAAEDLNDVGQIVDEIVFANYGTDSEFKMFPLKDADPVAVAKVLNELFKPEPIRNPQPRQGEPPIITPSARMSVVPEPRTRSLIVRGKSTDFILLQSLLDKLDVKGETAELKFESLRLENADVQKVLPLVNQAVQQLTLARPGEQIMVVADPRNRALFLGARTSVLEEVRSVIRSLDTPPAFQEAELKIVPLQNTLATQVVTMLQSLLRPGNAGEITAEARELQEQVRRLRVVDADGREVQLDLTQPIRLVADQPGGTSRAGNRILISSTPDNTRALAAVIAMMDKVSVSEGVQFKMVRLERADAVTTAFTLNTIFTQGQRLATGPGGLSRPEGDTGRGLTGTLNIAGDARSNSVLLSGSPESVTLALELLKDLDGDFKGVTTTVRILRLDYASAVRMAPMLQSVFAEGGSAAGAEGIATFVTRLVSKIDDANVKEAVATKARAALTIQADAPSNALIIAARSDLLPLIEDVVKAMDVPAATGMEVVRIYPLLHADPTRVSVIINELYAARSALMRPEDRPGLSVDPRTSTLIVTGNERIFGFVEALLAQLDREMPLELGDFRFVKLENAEATTVAAVVQRLMDARLQQKAALGLQRPESLRVLIVAEPRSNGLIIGGSNDSFDVVEEIVKQLDIADAGIANEMRIVSLEHANAGTLSQILNNLFNERYQALRSVDAQRRRPIILPDSRMNALLVAAGVEDSKALDALVEKLDRKPENPAILVEVLPLQHNDSTRVAALLSRFFAGRLTSITPAGQQVEPQERVTLEADPLSNSLVISANRENIEMAKSLLEQVDREPTTEGGIVQIIPLKNADAQRAATLLRNLIQQGLYRPGMAGGTRADLRARESLAIGVDSRANALIVSASPENLQVIREVVDHIDSDSTGDLGNIELFVLRHARASQLSTILEQFFRTRRAAEATGGTADRSLPVTLTADDRTNTLIVTGDRDAFASVRRMLDQLDVPDVFDKTNFRVFALKNTTATTLQSTLQRLFQNRPARFVGRPSEPINIVADSWANALIVGAANEDMSMVSSLIETLDAQPSDGALQVQVLPLVKADAASVAQTIIGLYREAPGSPSTVGVNVDERLNALVVSAGEQDMIRIEELVRKLDTEIVARISEIRIFPLRYAQAAELAQVLTLALTGRPEQVIPESPGRQSMLQFITRTPEGEQLVSSALKESLLIVSDARRNALVVSAPLESMNLLARLIQNLDTESPQLARIKLFKLTNADARQMSDLLISLFRLRQVPGQPVNTRAIQYVLDLPGPSNPVAATIGSAEQFALTVTVDLRTNALLIGGSDHYVELASGIIQDLDSTPAMERRSVVYRLRNAQATEVETALRSFLDQNRTQLTNTLGEEGVGTVQRLLEMEVAIVAETTSNALLLSASPQYFDQFKSLIEELDQPLPQVLIQVILAEVTLDKTMEFGVEWAVSGRRGSTTMGAGTDFGVANDLQSFGGFNSAVGGNDFGFLLRALQTDGRLEVLSRPQILTGDNQEASIDIGQLVPLITDSRVTQFGDSINSFSYTNVGVRLTVNPRISPDGFIRMEVEPVISQLSSATVDIGPDAKAPIINQRTARTTVTIQNGQSIIIGGLISTSDDERVRKVPVLGSIPFLGNLFRSTQKLQDRKELLIILTPHLIVGGDDARSISSDQFMRSTIRDQLQRDGLQRQILEPILPFLVPGMTNVPPSTPVAPVPAADTRRRSERRNL